MDKVFGSVQRRSEREIEKLANTVRRGLEISPDERLAMQPILEFALDEMMDGAYLAVAADNEMGGAEGRTDWCRPVITLAASTYAALRRGDHRARMTAAHELGHLLMHCQRPVFYYRQRTKDRRLDPEWQANYFAAALLMPRTAFRKMKLVTQVKKAFGVSRGAALCRARTLNHSLIDDTARRSTAKKKGARTNRTP